MIPVVKDNKETRCKKHIAIEFCMEKNTYKELKPNFAVQQFSISVIHAST